MEQLVQLVTERTGIPAAQASQAVQTVLGFLQERLPGPIAAQVGNILGGQNAQPQQGGGFMDKARDSLGGMFGH